MITVGTSELAVLDERRAATLQALCEVLIPVPGSSAAGAEGSAVPRIDALCAGRPAARRQVLWLIDRLEQLRSGFADCDKAQQEIAAASLEQEQPSAFRLVCQLACEDYYSRTLVRIALEQQTGWRFWNSLCGSSMEDFDESLLVAMGERPACYRPAP